MFAGGDPWFRLARKQCVLISHRDGRKTNADQFGHFRAAIEKNEEVDQRLDNCVQHMAMMQYSAAQRTSQFEQQRVQMQCDIVRTQFEMDDFRCKDPARVRSAALGTNPQTAYWGAMICLTPEDTS